MSQLTPLEANKMLDCIKTPSVRFLAMSEAMQAPLTPETRAAIRKRYLDETNDANR